MKEDIIQNIKAKILELKSEDKAILDIPAYPGLTQLLEIEDSNFQPTYYIPDTISILLRKAKENEQYYYFITKLLTRWTQRYIDIRLLNKIFVEKEFSKAKIEFITKEDVDEKVYSFCYKNFVSKDLVVELSPKFNLIGDIIGKILGFAKISETPILMMNQRLVREVKKSIPILDAANMFVDQKQKFFSKIIPLERIRGIRWFIGITVGTIINPVGFILTVIDP